MFGFVLGDWWRVSGSRTLIWIRGCQEVEVTLCLGILHLTSEEGQLERGEDLVTGREVVFTRISCPGDVWSFLWPGRYSRFVCFQT